MKVILGPGCDKAWRDSLSPWQHSQLAAIFRQGRGLIDGTDHGGDHRWRQRGVVTYERSYRRRIPRRPRFREGHEAIIVQRRDYGYVMTGVHRETGYLLDFETGELTERRVWAISWREWVTENSTANYPPSQVPNLVRRHNTQQNTRR